MDMEHGNDGVRYTVKELLAAQDKKLDSILQAVTNAVTGLDAIREKTVILETRETRAEKDIEDLKQTMYLAEQRRMTEMAELRKDVGEVDTRQEVDKALKSNRRWVIGTIVASLSAVVAVVIFILTH